MAVTQLNLNDYRDQRVIVKGCATVGGPATLVAFTAHVGPVVRSLMFGEACSAVPLVKNPRSHHPSSEKSSFWWMLMR